MKIGFNLLLWTTDVQEEHWPLLDELKKTGYHGVEVPLFGGEPEGYERLGKRIAETGLEATAVTVMPPEHDPTAEDPAIRDAGLRHLRWAIDCCKALDAKLLCGPIYQPLGVFSGAGPTEEEKARGAESHRTVADYAKEADVVLAVEALNRFECYFLNTMKDAADYVRRVGHPNVTSMVDSFHANIEEKDPFGAIRENASAIGHVHVSENDRGTPGKGHVDFVAFFAALKESGYDGWLTVEAFGRALPDLAAATRVWRDFFPDATEVYREGFRLIEELW